MIPCDYCREPAVRNYQRIWHVFVITRAGRYIAERVDYELGEPRDENNVHVCPRHKRAWLAGEI